MKVVDFQTWQKMPIGTVYAEWTPNTTLGDWSVKGSTGEDDITLYDASIIDTYHVDDQPEGKDIPLSGEMMWSRSTGCYYGLNCQKQPHRFLVLDEADIKTVIGILSRCIEGKIISP